MANVMDQAETPLGVDSLDPVVGLFHCVSFIWKFCFSSGVQ